MVKKRYDFEPTEGKVDIYVDGVKVRDGHPGAKGHVYLAVDGKVEAREHNGLKPVEKWEPKREKIPNKPKKQDVPAPRESNILRETSVPSSDDVAGNESRQTGG